MPCFAQDADTRKLHASPVALGVCPALIEGLGMVGRLDEAEKVSVSSRVSSAEVQDRERRCACACVRACVRACMRAPGCRPEVLRWRIDRNGRQGKHSAIDPQRRLPHA
jgi:hypothetical protein